tara:strand:- start:453 stop:896 length:444 start_codon:yes stop_codon:yes gene_type:complete
MAKEKKPIFISFVQDQELDGEIYDLVRMKEAEGCIIAFDKDRNILGIGFTDYHHILRGNEILDGKKDVEDDDDYEEEKRYKNNEESFTYDDLMEDFDGVVPNEKKYSSDKMSLKEIKQALIDDPELSDDERFEIYYENYQAEKERQK